MEPAPPAGLKVVAVVFGPSHSRNFPKALARARETADEVTEVEPGRFTAVFGLGMELERYAQLGALLEMVRAWRGSAVFVDGLPVSSSAALRTAWCASAQLRLHATCRYRFFHAIPSRCTLCPLLDRDRAERELRERPTDVTARLVIKFVTEVPDDLTADVPDFVPEEWNDDLPDED